mgnify:CR=1 FL=1
MRLLPLLFLLSFICIAFAEDAPKYSFGTMQDGVEFNATAGEELVLKIYFYMDEAYGNMPSSVVLSQESVPDGWQIEFSPPVHQMTVDLHGVPTTIQANIYVEPKPVLPELPEESDEETFYLDSPSGLGYLQAQRVEAKVLIPATAESGTYKLILGAKADYLVQEGMVAVSQARDFEYEINVTGVTPTPVPTSTPIPTSTPVPTSTSTPAQTTPANEGAGMESLLLPAGALLILALIFLAVFYFTKKGKK